MIASGIGARRATMTLMRPCRSQRLEGGGDDVSRGCHAHDVNFLRGAPTTSREQRAEQSGDRCSAERRAEQRPMLCRGESRAEMTTGCWRRSTSTAEERANAVCVRVSRVGELASDEAQKRAEQAGLGLSGGRTTSVGLGREPRAEQRLCPGPRPRTARMRTAGTQDDGREQGG